MAIRGKIIQFHDAQHTVDRALSALQPGMWDHVQYSLEPGTNGGFDPSRPTCASTWEHPKRGTVYTSDCIGLAMWCLGSDRYLPRVFFPQGGWVNTDGIIADIKKTEDWDLFRRVDGTPQPGDLVVYGSRKRVPWGRHPGHIGVVVAVPTYLDSSNRLKPFGRERWKEVSVIHCHGPTLAGRAIHKTTAALWAKREDATFVRFMR